MSEVKHTPWRVDEICPDVVVDCNGDEIAMCYGEDDEEHARLIAAAPELLEALEMVLREFECEDRNVGQTDALYAATAAISKAKGETE